MSLTREEISTLSRLLDEAQAVPLPDRKAWLSALPPEHALLAAKLEEMLAERDRMDTSVPATLSVLPPLDGHQDETVARAGDAIGPYRLLREIGRGGMGSVWLAERADGAYKRQLALKLPRLAWGAGLAERMARERDIGALLEHPNIARLYDAGVDERGRPYLALEHIDGQPIDAWCEAQGLDTRARLRLFVPVAKAVAYAHGRLVVHRDLKPSNVLVTAEGQVHLLDFGIAKLLHEGAAPGDEPRGLTQEQGRVLTPNYASPEQVAGQAITVQSDVYSLGVLLYELLTGTLPIEPERRTLGAMEEAMLQGDAPPASSRVKDRSQAKALRGDVNAILGKAMQREPQRRYATADALAQDIERHLAGETVTARPDSVAYRMRKALRRHWVGFAAATAVLIAVLTGSGVAVVQAERAARSAERERVVKDFVADLFRVSTQVDPRNTAFRPKSPRDLIDAGFRLIEARFAGQPELQAEVFSVVGGVFFAMGAYRVAANYALRRVEALNLARADRFQQANALIALADALFENRSFAESALRARRAAELADGDADAKATALTLMARAQISLGRRDQATVALDEADRLLTRGASSGKPSLTQSWIASARGRLLFNRDDETIKYFERAVDLAIASEGELSPSAARHRLSLAWVYSQLLTGAEASRRHQNAAISALRTLGGAHELNAAYQSAQFAWKRRDRMSIAARLKIIDESRATLASSQMPIPDWMVPQVDFWLGDIRSESGDIDGCLDLLERNIDVLWANLANPGDRLTLARQMGFCLSGAGRHEAAAQWFARLVQQRIEHGESKHPWAALDHVFMAINWMMDGRHERALSAIDQAPHFEPIRGPGYTDNPDMHNQALIWARAEVVADRGDWGGALALLIKSDPGETVHRSWRRNYDRVRAEALCGEGRITESLELFRPLLAAEEHDDHVAHAPGLARIRAVIGLCVLRTGDRSAALALAAQSRAAFTTQPNVSPYYKAPLFKLERALGLPLPAI